MKKNIFLKTIEFLFIVLFIFAFGKVFGKENILIAVTTIVAMLLFLKKDLTLTPFKSTIKLVVLNVFIGIMATLGSNNVWISIPINFISIFILGYIFCYSLSEPLYLPFILEYLLILTEPVSVNNLPIRFLALSISAISIMIVQLVFNKNRISKLGNEAIIAICDSIYEKIEFKKNIEDTSEVNKNINKYINDFRKLIYSKRESGLYLTDESRIKLNISVALEKINILLEKINYNEEINYSLNIVVRLIEEFKYNLLKEKASNKKLQEILKECNSFRIENIYVLEMLSNIALLYDSLNELNKLGKENYNHINKYGNLFQLLDIKNTIKRNFSKKSIKFCYGIRVALGLTITYFIITYFKISQGRWILLTVFSLINPLYEVAIKNTFERIMTTISGALVIMILFTIFKNIDLRMFFLVIDIYFITFINNSKIRNIFATVMAIGIVAINGNANLLSLDRIIYVIIGAIFASVLNKFILPFNINDSNNELITLYKQHICEMLKELVTSYNTMKNDQSMKILFIDTSLIENKLKVNSAFINNKIQDKFIENQRLLVCSIYDLYIYISKNKIKKENIKFILGFIKKLVHYKTCDIDKVIEKIKELIKITNTIEDKLILSNTIEVLRGIEKMNAF